VCSVNTIPNMAYSVGRQVVEVGMRVVEVVALDNTPSSPCSTVGRHNFVADIRFAPGNHCSLAPDLRDIGLHRVKMHMGKLYVSSGQIFRSRT
jgi:hypothetical protein